MVLVVAAVPRSRRWRRPKLLTQCEIRAYIIGVVLTPQYLQSVAAPVAKSVRDALEEGWSLAPEALRLLGVKSDPWLDSHMARAVARQRLEAWAADTADWSIDSTVPNSGIHLTVPAGNFRVLRGGATRVPAPGPNRSRRRFFQQGNVQPSLFDFDADSATAIINMLLLWTPNQDGTVDLAVAVPHGIWQYGKRARLVAFAPLDHDLDVITGEFQTDEDDGRWLVHDPADDESQRDSG